MRFFLTAGLRWSFLSIAVAQAIPPDPSVDTDRDGLSDALEDALLAQFAPRFMVSENDCSLRPAQFAPFLPTPQVQDEKGTIYGQAFPRAGHADQVELHYYHLWRLDCGEMSHPLDAEHVSALVTRDGASNWKALYWYAAAHENTLCDASQIARAATIDGDLHGPAVWISRGKHASFLSDAKCAHGCGGDKCVAMQPMAIAGLINLGESSSAMNGTAWAGSGQWPLAYKMSHSDFGDDRTAQADAVATTAIAWANPGKHKVQSAIHGGNSAFGGTAEGVNAAGAAMDSAESNTGDALNAATASTGSGLAKSGRNLKKALRTTARKLGLAE
jgi:hypothetical protein